MEWACNCPAPVLWKEAVNILSNHASTKSSSGVRKALFETTTDDVETVFQAMLRCCERDSPFSLWRLAREGGSAVGKEFLGRCDAMIGLLPTPWQVQFRPPGWSASFDLSAGDHLATMEELLTPTKRILLSGSTGTGGEASIRRQNSRAANSRERLRDMLSVLFLEPEKVKIKCADLSNQLQDAENESWFCECLVDVYLRFCNKLAEHERSMIEKTTMNVASSLQDVALARTVAEQLFEKNVPLWQQMCATLVGKIDVLRSETCELFVLASELMHVAQFLGVVTFLPVKASNSQFWSLPHALFDLIDEVWRKKRKKKNSFSFNVFPSQKHLPNEDARQVFLLLSVLDVFLEHAPASLKVPLSKSRVVRSVQRVRNGVKTMDNIAEVRGLFF
jgi:hypothetical protein